MKIKLEIKAADFEGSSYCNARDCAITRSLHRAGFTDLQDEGITISIKGTDTAVIDCRDPVYDALGSKVNKMYLNPSTREDFEVELDINY